MIQGPESCAPEFIMDDHNRFRSVDDWESDQAKVEEVAEYHKRRSAGVWTCLAALTVALVAAVGYGYTVLKQEGIQLEQIPGVTKSLPAINQHVASVERRLEAWRADQQNLTSKMQKIDAGWHAALGQTQQQTGKLVAQVQETLLKDLKKQTSVFQVQLSRLADERNSDHLHLVQVEEQLTQARSEVEAARRDYTRELEALREQQGDNEREIESISNLLATREEHFEIPKNQETEVAPGVSFVLTKTDVLHQRFDGWIESAPGNRRVWVQNQGVHTPVVFYPSDHAKALVMVVTRVNPKGATGYLLIPAGNGKTDQPNYVSAIDKQESPITVLPLTENIVAAP